MPLIRQPATRMALAEGLPFASVGLFIVVLIWGFLEGFLACTSHATSMESCDTMAARTCSLVRAWGGLITSLASGYAIAIVPALTANAWSGVLVQVLTNAVGS